jgi:hypothetical protein
VHNRTLLSSFSFIPPHPLEKSGVFKTEWTQGRVKQFIEGCKRREIIWDTNHPFHFNKIKEPDEWEEMATETDPLMSVKRK